jgi:DNA polymerase-3 subunit delta
MIKQEALFRELGKGTVFPLYLLLGEEEAAKNEFIDSLHRLLFRDADERTLGSTTYYGDDADAASIVERLGTYSFFSPRELVVVREFDRMKNQKVLLDYLSSPSRDSVLVLLSQRKSASAQLTRAVEARGRVCILWPMFENQGEEWVSARLASYGIAAEQEAVQYLIEVTGTGRNELQSQIACIVNYIAENETLTLDMARKILANLNTFSVFDLCNALFLKSPSEIVRIFRYLLNNGEEMVKIGYFISRELGRLLQACAMKEEGYAFPRIRDSLGLRKKESQRIGSILARIDDITLRSLYASAFSVERTVKSSPRDVGIVAFERLLVSMGRRWA